MSLSIYEQRDQALEVADGLLEYLSELNIGMEVPRVKELAERLGVLEDLAAEA